MKRVYICSPHNGEAAAGTARALCLKAAAAGFAPFSPHLLYAGLAEGICLWGFLVALLILIIK